MSQQTPTPVPAASKWMDGVRRALSQPSFIVLIIILAAAAIGLEAATRSMKLYFKKLPVPLARELETLPPQFGPWYQVSKDMPLEHDIEETLGTKQYIFRDYVDERLVGRDKIEQFKDKEVTERRKLLAEIERDQPQAVIHLAVTYYTGMVDTVAHIPDRCYIADGYEPKRYETVKWDVGTKQTADGKIGARFIMFEDQTGYAQSVTRTVAYFFHANGHYESDPLGVRRTLQYLPEKYGYYSKIELMSLVRDAGTTGRVMTDFLTHALPQVEASLPDWKALKAEK